jgi:hypothetical protein
VNHMNLGLALLEDGQLEEGRDHILDALTIFPGYQEYPAFIESIERFRAQGKLPPELQR